MAKQFTKEEKKAYFKGLRDQWKTAKTLVENGQGDEIKAIIATHGLNISATGYLLISSQMSALDLDGIPYLDAKTFRGWKENGFLVQKGEKSKLEGITWIQTGGDQEEGGDDGGYCFPRVYRLFHRSQVKAV